MGASGSTSTDLVMTLPLHARNCVDEEVGCGAYFNMLPHIWMARRETYLGPNRLMEELLNNRVLWSQYSQRMAEVMIELRKLEERRRNFNLM